MTAEALPVETGDEPVVGWRCWFVLPHELALRPIYRRGLAWRPGEAQEAVCPNDPHEPPAEGCKCGFWTTCHPMLLQEVGWVHHPPEGTPKLPGVLVVGEVALWGKVIQHERGWRGQYAYPRHLYAFTDDAAIAEGLRERYRVPVAYGAEAERLRRVLPVDDEEDAPSSTASTSAQSDLRAALLELTHSDRWPAALTALVTDMLAKEISETWRNFADPAKRIEAERKQLESERGAGRAAARRRLALAASDAQALDHDNACDARRALWTRLVRWQRERARGLYKRIQQQQAESNEAREDLAAGVIRAGRRNAGKPLAVSTVYAKRASLAAGDDRLAEWTAELAAINAAVVPTYAAWRLITDPDAAVVPTLMVNGVAVAPAQFRRAFTAWYRLAIAHEWRLAREREALEQARAALTRERAGARA
jgi:hypothetical protein